METSTGGRDEAFPETIWSSILSATDSKARQERLKQLCALYWRPVYKFVRVSWKKNIEEAKDLTQEFFAHVMESDLLGKYQPQSGRFRGFLKASLKNFLAETHRDNTRLKRGGGKVIVPLNVEGVETDNFLKDSQSLTAEELYDREWAEGLMADCVQKLRAVLIEEGKEKYFQAFERYDLCGDERPTYPQIAQDLGLSVHDVRNYLVQARARLKELVVTRIREYVTSRSELAQELSELSDLFRR
jgi:RNA polymerase sigma-70 factor (ECF subfamily)